MNLTASFVLILLITISAFGVIFIKYQNRILNIEISENVKIDDYRGTILAERLVFDIEKKKLNITSSDTDKVKANLNYK